MIKFEKKLWSVHHKIYLTIHNVDDKSISINPDNLIYVCKDYHNKKHHGFEKRSVYQFGKDESLIAVKSDWIWYN